MSLANDTLIRMTTITEASRLAGRPSGPPLQPGTRQFSGPPKQASLSSVGFAQVGVGGGHAGFLPSHAASARRAAWAVVTVEAIAAEAFDTTLGRCRGRMRALAGRGQRVD